MDKHIRRLDTDLARFEADLKEKQIESSDYDSSSSKGKKSEEGGGACERWDPASEGRTDGLVPRAGTAAVRRERREGLQGGLGASEQGGGLNLAGRLPAFRPFPSALGRTQKEKKAARARSKGKNSDEEAPKATQKKLKLVRT